MAVGRRPVIPEGFVALDLAFDQHGMRADAAMQTGAPHIYACGDVNGRLSPFLWPRASRMTGDTGGGIPLFRGWQPAAARRPGGWHRCASTYRPSRCGRGGEPIGL
ncbi:MAG: FAD-dependent oxidoreductase [Acidiferrobacter thiooxydans]